MDDYKKHDAPKSFKASPSATVHTEAKHSAHSPAPTPKVAPKPEVSVKDLWKKLERDWEKAQFDVNDHWKKLTPTDLHTIKGDRDELVKAVVNRYVESFAEVEAKVDAWVRAHK